MGAFVRTETARAEGEAGYAAIDAIVGLSILASVLTLSLVAARTSLRLASQAKEISAVHAKLIALAETNSMQVGESSGTTGEGLSWSVRVAPAQDSDPKTLCRLEVKIARKGRRSQVLKTLRPCAGQAG